VYPGKETTVQDKNTPIDNNIFWAQEVFVYNQCSSSDIGWICGRRNFKQLQQRVMAAKIQYFRLFRRLWVVCSSNGCFLN
jgi:hypothetical protein